MGILDGSLSAPSAAKFSHIFKTYAPFYRTGGRTDAQALQAAIEANDERGRLTLGNTHWAINAPVAFHGRTRLEGPGIDHKTDGSGAGLFLGVDSVAGTQGVFVVGLTTKVTAQFVIEGLTIDGQNLIDYGMQIGLLSGSLVSANGKISDVLIKRCNTAGMRLINSQNMVYEDVWVTDCAGDGIFVTGDTLGGNTVSIWRHPTVQRNRKGFRFVSWESQMIENADIEYNLEEGILIAKGPGATTGQLLVVRDSYFEGNNASRLTGNSGYVAGDPANAPYAQFAALIPVGSTGVYQNIMIEKTKFSGGGTPNRQIYLDKGSFELRYVQCAGTTVAYETSDSSTTQVYQEDDASILATDWIVGRRSTIFARVLKSGLYQEYSNVGPGSGGIGALALMRQITSGGSTGGKISAFNGAGGVAPVPGEGLAQRLTDLGWFDNSAAFPLDMKGGKLTPGSILLGLAGALNLWQSGTAAPTTGAHNKGEVVWNTNASLTDPLGWYCTTAGTPGTWKSFGPIGQVAAANPLSVGQARPTLYAPGRPWIPNGTAATSNAFAAGDALVQPVFTDGTKHLTKIHFEITSAAGVSVGSVCRVLAWQGDPSGIPYPGALLYDSGALSTPTLYDATVVGRQSLVIPSPDLKIPPAGWVFATVVWQGTGTAPTLRANTGPNGDILAPSWAGGAGTSLNSLKATGYTGAGSDWPATTGWTISGGPCPRIGYEFD